MPKRYSKTHKYEERDFVNVDDGEPLDCSVLPSRTSQEFAEEVDINTIARRFNLTGELPSNVPQVLQGDFEGVTDFQSAMNLIVQARESFAAMPAHVRAEFHNDAHEFLEFTSDPANYGRAEELGLVRPEVQAERARIALEQREREDEARAEALLKAREKASAEAGKASRKGAKDQSST